MKPIFQSTRRSRRRQPQTPEGQQEKQTPFFNKSDSLSDVQGKTQPFFQPKLTIGQPGDQYEQEADAVANQVVNGQNQAPVVQRQEISSIQRESLATPQEEEPVQMQAQEEEEEPLQMKAEEEEEPIQMKAEEEEEPIQMKAKEEEEPIQMKTEKEEEPLQMKTEEEEEPVQMKAEEEEEPLQMKAQAQPTTATAQVSNRIKETSGNGQALSGKTRVEMEQAFGVDFKGVNIHTDSEAVQLSQELGAQAFTHGKDVYFNSGKFRPENSEGKHLLAHELTHVVQQSTNRTKPKLQKKKALDEVDYMERGKAPTVGTHEPQETDSTAIQNPALLSGSHWVAKYPTSKSISDLSSTFQTSVQNFYNALIAAGAVVSIAATKRPPQRAFLMHYAFKIAREGLDPRKVPSYPGINIVWWHGNEADSVAAAESMVIAYNIAYRPALNSKHIQGNAIDMSISWSGNLSIANASQQTVVIDTKPRTGANQTLHSLGSSYGVHKLVSDPPHWSNDGG